MVHIHPLFRNSTSFFEVPEVTKEQRVIVDVAKYVKRRIARIGNGLLESSRRSRIAEVQKFRTVQAGFERRGQAS